MKIEIITPDKKIFDGDIKSVRVPGKKGSFQVLKDHFAGKPHPRLTEHLILLMILRLPFMRYLRRYRETRAI